MFKLYFSKFYNIANYLPLIQGKADMLSAMKWLTLRENLGLEGTPW